MNKKGDLAWEYIVAIILSLIVIILIVIFSTQVKGFVVQGIEYFKTTILGM
ncbi:hypothetical protein J4223_04275 [Candidatus Woesearchaeota archaeon]|nr:hypothetical protein [Candidatus Woesearchaeota archaeon]